MLRCEARKCFKCGILFWLVLNGKVLFIFLKTYLKLFYTDRLNIIEKKKWDLNVNKEVVCGITAFYKPFFFCSFVILLVTFTKSVAYHSVYGLNDWSSYYCLFIKFRRFPCWLSYEEINVKMKTFTNKWTPIVLYAYKVN